MGRQLNKYSEEFRRDAVAVVESSGRAVGEVARSLGVAEGTLWNWVRAARKAAGPDDAGVLSESERDELRRLRREVQELRTDTEILKRAAAYFARETMR